MSQSPASQPTVVAPTARPSLAHDMRTSEDWWAIWCAAILIAVSFAAVWFSRPIERIDQLGSLPKEQQLAQAAELKISSPLKPYLAKPTSWSDDPLRTFYKQNSAGEVKSLVPGILITFAVIGGLFAFANYMRGSGGASFLIAFPAVFLLAMIAYMMSEQVVIKAANLEYALWALLVGLVISNTIGTPGWLKPAVLTEFYIKTGLVLFGVEVLMSRLLALGIPGIFVAWIVTPIVLVSTYVFGQRVLKIPSRSLNMVISADMSVCGVSAAIATAAACKAKKEELSLAIGMSLSFTVIMMFAMPLVIKTIGMGEVLGGAWMGGTIDSTGAVVAAGAALGETAATVAAAVKMIQNILIGVVAFAVAAYWTTQVEREDKDEGAGDSPRVGLMEIWYRFPKFVLGFVGMSILFSIFYAQLLAGPELVDATIEGSTKTLRGWLFCLAFVSIGLDTNFRSFLPQLKGGKPLILYLCGQSLNLVLTLAMAYLMFEVIFVDMVFPTE